MRFIPESLFARTAAVLLATFLVFEAAALAVVWVMVVEPLEQRSADDLAAKIVLAAQTWVELPPGTRPDYEMELSFRHDLDLSEAREKLTRPTRPGYFGRQLEASLSRRTRQAVALMVGPVPGWDWAEFSLSNKVLRVGYNRERYVLQAPLAALGIFLLGAGLTVLTALFMVRQHSRRLNMLADKAREVGQGRTPERLPEDGAMEIRQLTGAFNRMADEVQALLENRTVLLSGISHDLRTPITRLRLALSMAEGADPVLVARMERDLDEMNRLITDMLAFARALKVEERMEVDLVPLLDDLARQASELGPVEWRADIPALPVQAHANALQRILANLLENGRRYGGDGPLTLTLEHGPEQARIGVHDRGPGIPAHEREAVFRPFYRLETSRNREGGGSGLGLAIVRQLADAYGWRVELADRKGGGLSAWVVLP